MVLVRLPLRGVAWGLLGLSAVFYAFAGSFDFALFAAMLIANGMAAVFVGRSRTVFWLAVAGNLAVLAAFKYRDMLLPSGEAGAAGARGTDPARRPCESIDLVAARHNRSTGAGWHAAGHSGTRPSHPRAAQRC